MSWRIWMVGLIVAFLNGACLPDAGFAPYTGAEDFDAKIVEDVAFLEGPSPYIPGELRLSVGFGYEGDAIETHAIDGLGSHSYIYILDECDETSALSYSPGTSTDRVEGRRSDLVTQGDLGWWGHGVHWDTPRDMRSWGRLFVSLKALSGHKEVELTMGSKSPIPGPDVCDLSASPVEGALPDVLATVQASTYGFIADGAWHSLEVPLSDFPGLDLSAVNIAISITREGGAPGDQLLIDNVYFTP